MIVLLMITDDTKYLLMMCWEIQWYDILWYSEVFILIFPDDIILQCDGDMWCNGIDDDDICVAVIISSLFYLLVSILTFYIEIFIQKCSEIFNCIDKCV